MRTSVDVHNHLLERDVPHEVFAAAGRLRSAEQLAAVLDLPPQEVGKVLIFESRKGPVAAVVPSGFDAHLRRLARAVRRRDIALASDDRASELTEYLTDAIPPAGLPQGFATVVDRSLARDAVLYFSGGEARSVLKIRGTDLVRATDAVVASIAVPAPPQPAR